MSTALHVALKSECVGGQGMDAHTSFANTCQAPFILNTPASTSTHAHEHICRDFIKRASTGLEMQLQVLRIGRVAKKKDKRYTTAV